MKVHLRQFILRPLNFVSDVFFSEYHTNFQVGLRDDMKMNVRNMLESELSIILLDGLGAIDYTYTTLGSVGLTCKRL